MTTQERGQLHGWNLTQEFQETRELIADLIQGPMRLEVSITGKLKRVDELLKRLEVHLMPSLTEAERLTDEILNMILSLATLDFSKKVQVGYEDSEFNAVAMGVNMLGQELERAVRKLNAEIVTRKKAEEEATKREKKYRNIFETTSVALWEVDLFAFKELVAKWKEEKGHDFFQNLTDDEILSGVQRLSACVTDVNQAAVQMFRATSKDDLVQQSQEIFFLESKQWFLQMLKAISEQQTTLETEAIFYTFTGKKIHALLQGQFFIPNGDHPSGLVALVDLTRQKELEMQLRQSQKMEAIGKLAGGIAHDFNNLLTVILNYGQMLEDELAPDSKEQKKAHAIVECGEKAASLTKHLLAFSRRQVIKPEILNINHVISKMEVMLRRLLGEDIHLSTHLHSDLNKVLLDASQLEQIILNLALNARDAMPKGGQLTIETRNVEFDKEYALRHEKILPGSYVVFSLSDTGIGMDEENQKRVFEPFFTTKEVGKGTGLGLSTVYGNVKQNNGYIWFYSELGHGTSFKVYFPVVEGEKAAEKPKAEHKEQLKGAGTILLAEDEESVREVAASMLRKNGYQVIEAKDGQEGILLGKAHQGQIDLLLTDVIMPHMNGRELAEQIIKYHPNIAILFMSGYTNNMIVKNGVLDEGLFFLEKPFTQTGLLEKVHACIERKQAELASHT